MSTVPEDTFLWNGDRPCEDAPAAYPGLPEASHCCIHNGCPRVTDAAEAMIEELQELDWDPPSPAPFCPEVFYAVSRAARESDDARAVRELTPLLAPPAGLLRARGAPGLGLLVDMADARPLSGAAEPVPPADHTAGFRVEAFSDDQRPRLSRLGGRAASSCAAGAVVFFPFLFCQANGGGPGGLELANLRAARDGTVAARAVATLLLAAGRGADVDRQVLAWTVSHDAERVRVWGHYALVQADTTTFHRHLVDTYDFSEDNGDECWNVFRFVRNLYAEWAPGHLERLRSALDGLPPPPGPVECLRRWPAMPPPPPVFASPEPFRLPLSFSELMAQPSPDLPAASAPPPAAAPLWPVLEPAAVLIPQLPPEPVKLAPLLPDAPPPSPQLPVMALPNTELPRRLPAVAAASPVRPAAVELPGVSLPPLSTIWELPSGAELPPTSVTGLSPRPTSSTSSVTLVDEPQSPPARAPRLRFSGLFGPDRT